MSNIWFTSDPHWGHHFMARMRGFSTIEEHDAALLDTFQETITKRDTVYWLGDLAMNNPSAAIAYTQAIPGTHHLILGNHDKAHPMHRDASSWQKKYFEAFESVQVYSRRLINRRNVLLSHHPYSGEGDRAMQERQTQYRLRDEGVPLIHGHVHAPWQESKSSKGTPQIHVGLDAWDLKPVPFDHVEERWFT